MADQTEEDRNNQSRFRLVNANLERHLQTVLISIVTGSLIFAANYFYSDNSSKAVLKSQLEVLTVQVMEVRNDIRSLQSSYVKPEEMRELQRRVLDLERDRRNK